MVNIVNIYFRAIIFYNFRGGLTQQQCIDELDSIFDDEAPSSTSVYQWYGEFNRDRSSLQDEFREGRLKSVVIPQTIDDVGHLILHDRHVTYREIATTLGISRTKVPSILHEHLIAKKKKKKFVHVGSYTICQSLNQSDKSTATIGSNACKSV